MPGLYPIHASSYLNPPKVSEKQTNKEQLPSHILSLVFDQLSLDDQKSAAQVGHLWNRAALATDQKELDQLVQFIEFITSTANQSNCVTEIVKLERLATNNKVYGAISLQKLKYDVSDLKEDILNILKDLDEEDLKHLEDLYKKKNFKPYEDFFDLARIYRRIDEAKKGILDESALRAALLRLCDELINKGKVEKVYELIDTLSKEDSQKEMTFLSLFSKLIDKNEITKAKKILNYFCMKNENFFVINNLIISRKFCDILLKNVMNDEAFEMAGKTKYPSLALNVYHKLIKAFFNLGNYEMALAAINRIDEMNRNEDDAIGLEAYEKLINKFFKVKNYEMVSVTLNKIDEKFSENKSEILGRLALAFLDDGDYDRAMDVFSQISDDRVMSDICEKMKSLLLQRNEAFRYNQVQEIFAQSRNDQQFISYEDLKEPSSM